MKTMLASFPFSNGFGTSLPLSRVKNLVIGNERTWFLYSKRRLLTQHIWELLQATPGPFLIFWVGPGNKARTGLWTKLLDWTDGLNCWTKFVHITWLHPIKWCKFGCINYLTISCTSSFYCMLGSVHECTMHKLHGRMCIMNSWCTCSEVKAPSDYSKHKRAWKVLTKGSLLNYVLSECEEERWCYWVVVTRLCNTQSISR